MAKYHINDNGKVYVCRANTNPCKYGDSNHYPTREAGLAALERKIEREHKTFRKLQKGKRLPRTLTMEDISSKEYSSETKAHIHLFEIMKGIDEIDYPDRRLHIGYPDNNYYSVSGVAKIDPRSHWDKKNDRYRDDATKEEYEQTKKIVESYNLEGKTVPDLVKEGYQVELVENTFKEESRGRFAGTFATSSDWESYVSAKAVFTSPKGEKFVLPVATLANAKDIVDRSLKDSEDNDTRYKDPVFLRNLANNMDSSNQVH